MPHALLIPGLGLDARAWQPTIEALQVLLPHYDLTVTPLPGYGTRATGQDRLGPSDLGARIGELVGPHRPVLFGHSASCQIAARAATAAPAHVSGLVLVGPTTDPRASSWRRLAGRWLATARHEPPQQIPHLLRQYRRTGLGSIVRAMDAARRDRIDETLRRVRCPVLILRGRHDRIAPPEWLEHLARQGPRVGAQTLTAGGHMVPLTHGRLTAEAVAAGLP